MLQKKDMEKKNEDSGVVVSRANQERKVYSAPALKNKVLNQIPNELLNNQELAAAISVLPSNYTFEIHKSVRAII